MNKIILDTNMFLSGILHHGMVKLIFDLILEKKLVLYVSPSLKTEVLKKLEKFQATKQEQHEAELFLERRSVCVYPNTTVTACRDPKDNFLLELAESSSADYLITRDKDLLDLPNSVWKSTKIIKPEDFLPLLRSKKLID